MPLYDYECQNKECGHVMVIERRIADCQVLPESCDKCKGSEFKKIILPLKKEQTSMVWGGIAPAHDEAYSKYKPIR